MNENLKELIKDYKNTNWEELLQTNHGEYHLKELKPYLDFIKEFTNPLIDECQNLSHNQQNILVNLLQEFKSKKEHISNYEGKSQRQQMINNIIGFKNWILDNCQPLSWSIETQKKYDPNKSLTKPELSVRKYKKAVKEIEKELQIVRQARSQYAEQEVRYQAARYGEFFKTEAKNNKISFVCFGIILLVFSAISCWFVYVLLNFEKQFKQINSFYEFLIKGNILFKVFTISIILLLISLLKREYLVLRHQYTLNKHRHNAIESHKELLNSVLKTGNESEKEISNAMLLELTKAIFSIQETGFVKNQKNTSSENKIVEISKSLFSNYRR